MTEPSPPHFDVFLSYHWRDHAQVEGLARRLQEQGLQVFLDRWYLTPGKSWLEALETMLGQCRAVAVCLGPGDMGPWQQREQYLAPAASGTSGEGGATLSGHSPFCCRVENRRWDFSANRRGLICELILMLQTW